MKQFVFKIDNLVIKKKKPDLLVDSFEICLDSKFPVRGEILKKKYSLIRNFNNYFESFN